ncbi:methyltransferase [Shewanella sp. CG12_big_fil_rev_8_21_14_0_65_47_15]|uniref:methyltransferase n=1 Tax=Shewanella sp. CG12_big_fil_rev_8_21_14_0_65_47_15 TaxID=1975537 RepID=UPI000CBB4C42|nr:methyltransferase [Shewanella sp. CG12_big_fil_rev_8_21_14_0_65_47_15]PIW60288.1 MAG: methyltransferase [Shewanella sp. CG12_big_fil_rev_8_21_14_0_65_47_15]
MNQTNPQNTSSHKEQFNQINQLLEQSRPLWQVRAFEANVLPWQADFPYLAQRLWDISDDDLDNLDAEQARLVKALLPALNQDLHSLGLDWDLSLLTATPVVSGAALVQTPEMQFDGSAHFSANIKGRKWTQITAFVANIPDLDLPVLEWCAGKGHLGRLIAKTRGVDVVSLEWQAKLCEEGQAFAQQWQLSQRFICADAFAIGTDAGLNEEEKSHHSANENPLTRQQQAVALHACGDLHVRLLKLATEAGTRALAISPCCYHLIQASHYQPLSTVAKQSTLKLSRHDLQLPLQQSVIANAKQQALRHQEIAWRLGFDALQRQCRQIDEYLPLPSLKQSQLSGSFADFCLWAAQQKSVLIPQHCDFAAWLERGRQRQRLTRRIDLVAHLFRSLLERWLILDRCCFLQEHGYRVSVGEFCANSVTPRNALILALKSDD